ncbi:MAG: hypothetical protein AMXMBFR84_09690 [Candidatus Hydrogenedentota bacterium]
MHSPWQAIGCLRGNGPKQVARASQDGKTWNVFTAHASLAHHSAPLRRPAGLQGNKPTYSPIPHGFPHPNGAYARSEKL